MAKRRERTGARAVALATLVMACSGKSATTSATAGAASAATVKANDALFALAPAGTEAAVVVSGRAIELFEATRVRGQAIARADPAMGELVARAEASLTDALGLAHGATLAALGLGHDRGFAFFKVSGDRTAWIWPVVDRKAFVAALGGRAGVDGIDTIDLGGEPASCREVKGVYACAADARLLDQLGAGSLAGKVAAAGARGEVEVVAQLGDVDAKGATFSTAVAIGLEPGQLIVRGRVAGALGAELRELVGAPVRVDAGRAAGFFAFALPRAALADIGGPVGEALRALRGPITAVAPSGVADIDVKVPLAAAAPVRALLAHCDQLPLPSNIALRGDGDRCRITSQQPPLFSATAWLDGNTLRINRSGGASATATGPAMTAAGRELALARWTVVAWGRGIVDAGASGLDPASFGEGSEAAALGLRAIAYLRELGIGMRLDDKAVAFTLVVRTALANPPAVADALPGLIARAVGGADIAADLASLARANPGSPLADDLAAGPTGLSLPTMTLGMVAAVAIPKFLDYMTVSKRSEAELNLDAMRKAAEAELIESGRFPVATAPLTPARPCCEGLGRRCPAVATDWNGVAAWDALGFEVIEPSFFQYSYESDGLTLRATAVGDLDCDGVTATYELRGAIEDNGRPRWELVRPSRAD